MIALILQTLLTTVSAGNDTILPADTLVTADFDDAATVCEIDDEAFDREVEIFPWLRTDLSKIIIPHTLVNYATSFIGLPYRRGGKTQKGFDCSGFTGFIFRSVGIRLGASSRDQYRQGIPIAEKQLSPGDLVFFSGRAGDKSRVGHVGMVIDRDPESGIVRFIHSTHRLGITVSRLDEDYYSRRYIGARRVI